jgi:sugar lactone lactonase YvrE
MNTNVFGPIYKLVSALLLLLITLSAGAQSISFDGVVTTLAGNGTASYLDATGTAAEFKFPYGAATDAAGNIYVADYNNHRIRKITPLGVVTTFAGSGTAAYTNGTGTGASFNSPSGVAVDASGNVYVADKLNHRIRQITSGGVVTTLAGSGTAGFANGTGAAAQFSSPTGVAVDASGNVTVADQGNQRIRQITPGGVVTTLAGSGTAGFANGTGTAAQFNYPFGVAVDASGNVFVGDQNNHRIRQITSAGVVTTLAGTGTAGYLEGAGVSAQFNYPYGVAVDPSGNVYVADYYNYRIRLITPAGMVSTLAGKGTPSFSDGAASNAQFNNPISVTIDASGNIYVVDQTNQRIRKIAQAALSPFSTAFGTASAQQSFNVSGSGLTGNLVVTAPSGYEVSLSSGTGFANSVSLTPAGGVVYSNPIYIRLSATAPGGTNSGDISLTSTGAPSQSLAVTGIVSKINQTITFGALAAKIVSDPSFTLSATASSGLAVSYTSSNTAVATVSGSTVTIVGLGSADITASQAGNSNYNAAPDVVQTLTVNKGNQTITFGPLASKTAGDADFNLTATASSGLAVTYTSSDPTVATVSGNTVTILSSGSTNITASQAGDASYNAATDVVQVLSVKSNQTITFGTLASKTFGDSPFDPGATASSGLSVIYTSSNISVATVSGSTITIVGAGSSDITASQTGNGTYNPAVNVVQTLVVDKENQTITFGTLASATYHDSPITLGATASSNLIVSYTSSDPSVAMVSGNTVTIVGAGSADITATQNGSANFNAAPPVIQTLTVNKADQTIPTNPFAPATYGQPDIHLISTATSGLLITYSSSDPSVATVSGNIINIVGAGTTIITASQVGNNNYNPATSVGQLLTVSKANQDIIFNPISKTMLDPAFDLDPLATISSGLALTFTSDNPSVATIDGNNVVTIVGVGIANITASQAGNANYNAASITSQLTVTRVSQTITFTIPAKTVADPAFDLDALASTTSGLTLTFTSDNSAVATIDANNVVTIVGTGTANITAIQAGDAIYADAILVRQLVVSKLSQTINFSVIPIQALGGPSLDLSTLASTTSGLTLTFTSSNPAVATVSGNIVTMVAGGNTNITATQSGDATYAVATPVMQVLMVTVTGLSSNMTVLESKIYPNPTSDVLNIEPKQRLYGDLTMTISDMQGKVAYSSKVQGGEDSYKVDISSLGSGVFVLELSNGRQMINQRIIKK